MNRSHFLKVASCVAVQSYLWFKAHYHTLIYPETGKQNLNQG